MHIDPFLSLSTRMKRKKIQIAIVVIVVVAVIHLLPTLNAYGNHIIEEIRIGITKASLSVARFKSRTFHQPFSPKFQLNSTHLWSIPFAGEYYQNLSRLLPCRSVTYLGVQQSETLNSCNPVHVAEFSQRNTIQAQRWIFHQQHPTTCVNKRFAIISNYALSGFGSTIHQIVWAFGKALSQGRIAVFASPGDWLFGDCPLGNPECFFLTISNCSVTKAANDKRTIYIDANIGYWPNPTLPPIFRNRTFNWYRAQLLFYLMRYNSETLNYVQQTIAKHISPPIIDAHRPFVSIYVRRSDKVLYKEMSQAYPLKQYFSLFDQDARRAHIRKVYLNSEDGRVFQEFIELNKTMQEYYQLLTIPFLRDIVCRKLLAMSSAQRKEIVLQFLTDLYIETHADMHVGTLSSNWCRLVDEMRLVIGKVIPYYTPENVYLMVR